MNTPGVTREEPIDAGIPWWVALVVGLASVVAGAILVAKPSHSLATLAVVFGIFVLIDSVVELIGSLAGSVENRALAAIVGVLGLIVGLLLIRHPTHAVSAIGILIGIWLVAAGVIRLVGAIVYPGRRLLRLLVALLEVLVGIVIVADPHIGYATLAVIAGIWLIVGGLGSIIVAFAARAQPSGSSTRG